MAKKQITITTLVGITTFVAGFLLRSVWNDFTADNAQSGNGAEQTSQSGASSSQWQILSQETGTSSGESAEKENAVSADSIQVRIDDGQVQWYDGTVWHTVATVEELSSEDRFYLAQDSFQAFTQELQQEKVETMSQSQPQGTFTDEDGGLSVGKKETPKPTPKPATPKPAAEETSPQEPVPEDTVPAAPSNPTPSNPTPPPSTQTPPPSEGDGEDMEWTPDMT